MMTRLPLACHRDRKLEKVGSEIRATRLQGEEHWLDFNRRATNLVARSIEFSLYRLHFIEERVASGWPIRLIDAIWLHVGMLAFTCHKIMCFGDYMGLGKTRGGKKLAKCLDCCNTPICWHGRLSLATNP